MDIIATLEEPLEQSGSLYCEQPDSSSMEVLNDLHSSSPTRVSEFENDGHDHQSEQIVEVKDLQDIPQLFTPPDIGPVSSFGHRRRRPTLPTLEEVSSSSSAEDDGSLLHHPHREEESVTEENDKENHQQDQRAIVAYEPPPFSHDDRDDDDVGCRHDQVMGLKSTASRLALRGNEEEAIKMYKRALRMTRMELGRIRKNVKSVSKEPKNIREMIHLQLHDDWLEVALIIAEIRTLMAILYERLGNYQRAISCCKEARTVYQRQARFEEKHNTDNKNATENVEKMTHMLAQLKVARESFYERKRLHEEAVLIRSHIQATESPETKANLYDQLFDKLFTVLELESNNLGQAHPQVADTMSLLSSVFVERNEMEAALQYMFRALSITELSLGSRHPRTGSKFREIARIYETRRCSGDDIMAIEYYEKAIEVFRESCVDQAHLEGSALNDVAVIHIQRGEYDIAVEKLSDALISYENTSLSGASLCSDTAQVWRNLGECYVRRREWDNAVMAFTSGLEVQRDARRLYEAAVSSANEEQDCEPPYQPLLVDDESIADTLKRLAKATASLSRYSEAVVIFEQALQIHRDALLNAMTMTETPRRRGETDLSDKQDQVAHTLYCIAEVQEARGSIDAAMKLFTESLQLRLFSDALRGEKRINMVHCAMCLAGIGALHVRKEEFYEACRVFENALEFTDAHGMPGDHQIVQMIKQRLQFASDNWKKVEEMTSALDTRVGSWQSYGDESGCSQATQDMIDKTIELDKQAQCMMEEGDTDGAIKTLVSALAVRRKRLIRQQKNGNYECGKEREDIARTLVNFGTILTVKKQSKQAELLFTEAIQMYLSSGRDEQDPCIREIFMELEQLRALKKRK